MRSYNDFNWPRTQGVQRDARRQGDLMVRRGITLLPPPPRNVRVNSGAGYITALWHAPQDVRNVQSWRVYLDTESKLIDTISDTARTSTQVSLSDHAVHNVHVSSVNPLGKESRKVRAQGAAS